MRLTKTKKVAILLLVVGIGILTTLIFTRFHFSNQMFPVLAKLQWKKQSDYGFSKTRPLVIGHRGSGIKSKNTDLLIGNTANAIQQGIQAGVDWIEIDIRRSSDGHLIAFHDERIDEKTNGKGKVSNMSLASLKTVSVVVEPPESILTLDELFTRFGSQERKWVFDIKVQGIQKQVLKWIDDAIDKGKLSSKHIIIFGTYDILIDYKDANYSLGYTAIWTNFGNRLRTLFYQSQFITRCKYLNCEYIVLPFIFANQQLIENAKLEGVSVWVYGTDDGLDINFLTKRGVTGFIIDQPKVKKVGSE